MYQTIVSMTFSAHDSGIVFIGFGKTEDMALSNAYNKGVKFAGSEVTSFNIKNVSV